MDKNSADLWPAAGGRAISTEHNGEDANNKGICPAALGTKDEQPAAFSPETGLFYVPTNHVCMDYEPFRVSYTAGQPYVGATCRCIRRRAGPTWANSSPGTPRTERSCGPLPEQFSVWSGALATDGGVVFYGTLEGYLKAVDAKTGKELYKFKTPSGIIGNVMTYEHSGKQYVAVLSGVGGWAGIGSGGGFDRSACGSRCCRRLRGAAQLHRAWRQLTVFSSRVHNESGGTHCLNPSPGTGVFSASFLWEGPGKG